MNEWIQAAGWTAFAMTTVVAITFVCVCIGSLIPKYPKASFGVFMLVIFVFFTALVKIKQDRDRESEHTQQLIENP